MKSVLIMMARSNPHSSMPSPARSPLGENGDGLGIMARTDHDDNGNDDDDDDNGDDDDGDDGDDGDGDDNDNDDHNNDNDDDDDDLLLPLPPVHQRVWRPLQGDLVAHLHQT